MRLNTAVVIAAFTLIIGLSFSEDRLWVPATVLAAGIFDLATRDWYSSSKLGSSVRVSVMLKFFCSLIGFYAMIGQLLCVGLLGWWLFT